MSRAVRFLFMTYFLVSSASAWAAGENAQGLTLDGTLYSATDFSTPLLDNAATLKIQILDQDRQCVLYEETQIVNTVNSNGRFNIQVGSATGALKRSGDDPNHPMIDIFQNVTNITATNGTCPGGIYDPDPGDVRFLRVQFTPSATGIPELMTPDMTLTSVPSALVAESVQGLDRDKLAEFGTHINAAMTQPNLLQLFDGSDVGALHNHDAEYAKLSNSNSITLGTQETLGFGNFTAAEQGLLTPTLNAGDAGKSWYNSTTEQMMYWDGDSAEVMSAAGGAVTQVFGRTGNVVSATSDYDAVQVDNTPNGVNIAATNVQAAIDELDNEKLALAGGTMAGAIDMGGNLINDVTDPASAQDAATKAYVDSAVSGLGNGDVLLDGNTEGANITIGTTDNFAMNFETNDTTRMTISNSGSVGVGTPNPATTFQVTGNTSNVARFHRDINTNGAGAGVEFFLDDSAGNEQRYGAIFSNIVSNTNTAETGELSFVVTDAGADRTVMNLTNDGAIEVPERTGAPALSAAGEGKIYFDDADNKFKVSENGGAYTNLTGGGGGGDVLLNGNTEGADITIGTTDNFALNLETNNTTRMTVANDGNVGFGIAPSFPIHSSQNNASTGAQVQLDQAGSGDVFQNFRLNGFVSWGVGVDNSDLDSFKISQNTADGLIDTNTRFTINTAGNIGMGVTAPEARAHIQMTDAGADAVGFLANNDALILEGNNDVYLQFLSPNNMGQAIMFSDVDAKNQGMIYYNHASNHMEFETNGAEAMRILSNGNVGIGTTGPAAKLEISGNGAIQSRISSYGAGSTGHLNFYKAQGTQGTPTAVLSTTTLANIIATGRGATVDLTSSAAKISFEAEENWTDATGAASINFHTRSPGNTAGANLRMKVTEDGTLEFQEITGVAVSPANTGRIYYDSAADKFRVSENNGAYVDLVGAGGGETLDQTYDLGATVTIDDAGGDVIWNMTQNADFRVQSGGTDAFTVRENGNVGIGGMAVQDVHIRGGGSEADFLMTNNATGNAVGDGFHLHVDATQQVVFRQQENAAIRFDTDGANERMRINGAGNVGIGTTAPTDALTIEQASGNVTKKIKIQRENVDHGMTLLFDTDDILSLGGADQADTGGIVTGLSNGANYHGLTLQGVVGDASPAATTAAIRMNAGKKSGTTFGAIATGDLALTVESQGTNLFRVTGDGDLKVGSADGLTIHGNNSSTTPDIEMGAYGSIMAHDALNLVFDSNGSSGASEVFTVSSASMNPSAATEFFRVSNSGLVGIGVNDPNTILDLDGAISVRQTGADPAVSVAGEGRIYYDTSDNKFKVSENNGAYVDLIGASGGNTLDAAYDQGGAGAGRVINVDSDAVRLNGSSATDETLEVLNSGNGGTMVIENTGGGDSLRVNDQGGDTTPFIIKQDGKVGIGLQSPDSGALDIDGTPGGTHSSVTRTTGNSTGTAAGTDYATFNQMIAAPGAASTRTYVGVRGTAYTDANTNMGGATVIGGNFAAMAYDGATLGTAIGISVSNGTINPGATTLAENIGVRVNEPAEFASTTITDSVGIAVDQHDNANNNTNLMLGTLTIPVGNYSIYNSSVHQNYLEGDTGIGVSDPNTKLDMDGAFSFRQTGADPAVSVAGQGRIYYDNSLNKFRVSENNGAYQDLVGGGGSGDFLANGTVAMTGSIDWSTGTAVTNGNYEILRNNDGTNNLQFNVPDNAGFKWSDNGSTIVHLDNPNNTDTTLRVIGNSEIYLQAWSSPEIATNSDLSFIANHDGANTSFNFLNHSTDSYTHTSGAARLISAAPTMAPTSGTGTLDVLSLTPTINQTGGANGVTRGLHINPTLTSAADFRALETVVGDVILGSTSGDVGIGVTAPATRFHVSSETAATNTVTNVGRLTSQSSGTPATGIGVGLEFEVETAAGNNEVGASIQAVTVDVSGGSEDFELIFNTMEAGGALAERVRIGNNEAPALSVSGDARFRRSNTGIARTATLWNNNTPAADRGVGLDFHGGASIPKGNIDVAWEGATDDDTYMAFSTRGTDTVAERVRITSVGNVGIGVNDPNTILDLDGAISYRQTGADPAVSVAGEGRIYYDNSLNKFRVSENNGAYTDLVGGGGGATDINGLSDAITDYATDENMFIGQGAGASILVGGQYNLGIGENALNNVDTGDENIAIGHSALFNMTTGVSNIGIGADAGGSAVQGNFNIGIGDGSLGGITGSGSDANIGIGINTFNLTTGGADNIAIGYRSGTGAGVKSRNIFIGTDSGGATGNAVENILIGHLTGDALSTGDRNLIIGYDIDAQSDSASNQLSIGNIIFSDGYGDVTGTAISSANIGIGVTNPAQKLEVNGIVRIATGAGVGVLELGNQEALERNGNNTILKAAGTDAFNISTGGINISSTSSIGFSPSTNVYTAADTRLTREGAGIFGQVNGTNAQEFRIYNTDNGANDELASIGFQQNTDVFTIETEQTGTGVVRDIALMGGSVGVGTTTPSQLLDVAGNARISDANGKIFFNGGNHWMGRQSTGELTFRAGGSTAQQTMYLDGSGFMGLGLESPDARIHAYTFDSGTNDALPLIRLQRATSGTPAAGFGAGIEFEIHTAGANEELIGQISAVVEDVSAGTEDGAISISTMTNGAAVTEKFRVTGDGALQMPQMGTAPSLSAVGNGRIYFDDTDNKFKVSENGGAYVDLIGAGGGDFFANGTVPMTGPLNIADGTVATPSIRFNTDTDTGITNDGNDGQIQMVTNGDVAWQLANIGYINQFARHQIQVSQSTTYSSSSSSAVHPAGVEKLGLTNTSAGDGTYAGIRFVVENTANTTQTAYLATVAENAGTSPTLVFGQQTGANAYDERLRIDPNGRVGIGVTDPNTPLDIDGGISYRQTGADPAVSVAGQGRIYYDNSLNKFRVSENNGAYVDLVGGAADDMGDHEATQNIDLNTFKLVGNNGTDGIAITAAGDVQITENLEVDKRIFDNAGGTLQVGETGDALDMNDGELYIHTTGDVGIGTTAPRHILQVGAQNSGAAQKMSIVAGDNVDASLKLVESDATNEYGFQFRYEGANNLLRLMSQGATAFGTDGDFGTDVFTALRDSGHIGFGSDNPVARVHINKVGVDPLASPGAMDQYNLYIGKKDNTNGESVGLAFAHTAGNNNVGASIAFKRIGSNSQGSLHFLTKQNTTTGGAPTEALVITEDGALEVPEQGSAPALSAADKGRIYFDATDNKFKVSENGGAYADLVSSGGGPAGTNEQIQFNSSSAFGASANLSFNNNLTLHVGPQTPYSNTNHGFIHNNSIGPGSYIHFHDTTTGTAQTDGFQLGANGNNAEITNRESGYLNFSTADTERMRITSAGDLGIGLTVPDMRLHVEENFASVNDVQRLMRFTRSTSGTPANGIGTGIDFEVETAVANNEILAIIDVVATDVSSGNEDGDIIFATMNNGSAANYALRITSDNALQFPEQSTAPAVSSTLNGRIYFDQTDNKFKVSENGGAYVDLISAAGATDINGLSDAVYNATDFNLFLGPTAGTIAVAGMTNNIVMGHQAMDSANVVAADNNIAIGSQALTSNVAGAGNVTVGVGSGENTTGGFNVYLGFHAGQNPSSGANNVGIGNGALLGDSGTRLTGANNVAVGYNSLRDISSTSNANVAIGANAGLELTVASKSTFVGSAAGQNVETGSSNVAIGDAALQASAANKLTGAGNVAIGTNSLKAVTTTADENVAIGLNAGDLITTGSDNILIGTRAGDNMVLGSTNILIGHDIDAENGGGNNQLSIGNLIYGTGGFGTGTTIGTGNIGIGVKDPNTRLDLDGGVSFRQTGADPAASVAGQGRIYYDNSLNKFRVSENNGAYVDLVGGASVTFPLNSDADGTEALPAFSFDGTDNDNGMFLAAANQLGFSTSGSEAIRIDSNQDIGIGTDTPSNRLHVTDSTGTTMRIENTVDSNELIIGVLDGDTMFTVGSGVNNHAALTLSDNAGTTTIELTGGNDDTYFNTTGDFGIGTNNPTAKLHVNDTSGTNMHLTNDSASGDFIVGTANGNNIFFAGTGTNDHGEITLGDSGGTTQVRISAGNVDSFWTGTGDFGLGITNPTVKVHLAEEVASANSIQRVQRITRTTSGTPAVGIGTGMDFEVETAAGSNHVLAAIDVVATDLTSNDEMGDIVFSTMYSGVAASEVLRLTSDKAVEFPQISTPPALSTTSDGRIYFDQTDNKFKVSENGGAYVDLIPPAGSIGPIDDLDDAQYASTEQSLYMGNSSGPGTLTNKERNTAVGFAALDGMSNSNADDNTAFGHNAGGAFTAGSGNTFFGSGAGDSTTSTLGGSTGIGYKALSSSASYATAVGWSALANTSGEGNSALGHEAGLHVSTGTDNVAIGNGALQGTAGTPITGDHNVAVGYEALLELEGDSNRNVALGYHTGENQASGNDNIYIGDSAGRNITSGSKNLIIGSNISPSFGASSNFMSIANVIYGTGIGDTTGATESAAFIGIGTDAPLSRLDVDGAITMQEMAAPAVSAAHDGRIYFDNGLDQFMVSEHGGAYRRLAGALDVNGLTDGISLDTPDSIYIGDGAGGTLTTMERNTALGHNALASLNNGGSDDNVGIGFNTGNGGSLNTRNVFIGSSAGASASGAVDNILIGYQAGNTLAGGDGNLLLGHDVDVAAGTTSDFMSIGNIIFATGGFGVGTAIGAGNIGIGVNDPNTKLDLDGGISFRQTGADPAASVAGQGRIYYDNSDNKFKVSENNGAYVDLVGAGGATEIDGLTDGSTPGTGADMSLLLGELAGGSDDGDANVAIGRSAASALDGSGLQNVAVGTQAALNLSSGDQNVAVGHDALRIIAGGANNTAVGWEALRNAVGGVTDSTAVGSGALRELDGNSNTGVGKDALTGGVGGTGTGNVALGISAGAAIEDGDNNIFIGRQAGNTITDGNGNIMIGNDVDFAATDSNQLTIGNVIFATGGFGTGTNVGAGDVGIGINSPRDKLHIHDTGSGQIGLVITNNDTGTADPNGSFVGINATEQLLLWNGENTDVLIGADDAEVVRIKATGEVGVGVTDPDAKLEVDGQIVSQIHNNGSGTTFDFNNGNNQYSTADCGSLTLQNMVDGGTYTITLQGSTGGTCDFTHTGLTFKAAGGNDVVQADGDHIAITFVRMGTFVYVSHIDDFQDL